MTGWEKRAACARHPEPELWFPPKGAERATAPGVIAAKRVCRACPVAEDCLAAALADDRAKNVRSRAGIRGGLTVRERARLIRNKQKEEAA